MSLHTKNKDYRADIDGLRAVAILSVVIYHVFPDTLPGGFVGVDVFFVISGFLISSHLLDEIRIKEDFSFSKFYVKRVKRILPALLFMNLLTLLAGYFLLTNFYFHSLGDQAHAANLSYSNIFFYLTSGYFDIDSQLKPLLQTWSLGVEEQFYLIWPALLVSLNLVVKEAKHFLVTFICLFALSFFLNGVFSDDESAIFYLLPFRMFEFIAGAIIAHLSLTQNAALLENRKTALNFASILSLILIVAPMFYLNESAIFPYYNALPVVFGSVGLIYFRNSPVAWLLSLKWVVFIGLISYSLYLYHWPVMVFLRYQFIDLDPSFLSFLIVFLSFVFALLSYYLVEKPFRFSRRRFVPILFFTLVMSVFLSSSLVKMRKIDSFGYAGELIHKSVKTSMEERKQLLDRDGCQIYKSGFKENCNWGAENQILFFGNSHNPSGYNAFYTSLNSHNNYNLIYPGDGDFCIRESLSGVREDELCGYGEDNQTLDQFLVNIDVLVVNFFNIKVHGAEHMSLINDMRELHPELKIIVIGGFIGTRPHSCRELINQYENLDICKEPKFVTYWGGDELDWLSQFEFTNSKFLYVDTVRLLCGDAKQLDQCVTRIGEELMFYDGDHISLHGSTYLGQLMFDQYRTQLNSLDIIY